MRFSQLLAAAEVAHRRLGRDVEVSGLSDDSRRCGPGCCFVAVRGTSADGHRHLGSAIANGAAAVVCEDPSAVANGAAAAIVADTRQAAGRLAQAMLGFPARKLTKIGVTGTNGKTTVASLIRGILDSAGHRCGVLGTISHQTGRRSVAAGNTTPGAVETAGLIAEMVQAARTHLVMEVSSHALDQDRTAGIDFDVAVFTNLSGDHLDYHGTRAEYLAAKRKLFEPLGPGAKAVINRDDERADAIAADLSAPITWYGLTPAAALHAVIERIDAEGTHFAMIHGGRAVPVSTPLIGRHNVSNCLAAAGAAMALGLDAETAAAGLAKVTRVPGRLERVAAAAPYQVFVDYAHTDDALKNVLGAMKPVVRDGRLILVFGCGGDRDRTKRPRMADVACRYADRIVVTSDNPRSEEPGAIIEEILVGLDAAGRKKTDVEPDRRSAIERAIGLAQPGDMVLIAGKGHEDYQIIGSKRLHFDDVEVARQAIDAREGTQ